MNIAGVRDRISFEQGDDLEVLRRNADRPDAVFFIDPPYTVAAKRLYNPLGIYKLTAERIRHLSEEEIERREARARRSQGFRDLYEALDLRVVAHKDCTLEITWGGGQTTLRCPDLRGRVGPRKLGQRWD